MVRPTIVAIFDLIAQEVILASAVYPNGETADIAYLAAIERLDKVELEMAKPTTSLAVSTQSTPTLSPTLGTSETEFSQRVQKAKEYILNGDVFQVVIGQRLSSPMPASPLKPGTVTVTERFTIERYSHVMHIVSNVEGELLDEHDAISALFAGFPAGTVSGAPKVRAMEIIDELEDEKRGIYAGAVGYISCEGEMDTAIALRTAIIKDGILHVRAGAGIVMDSVPQMEFEETLHKSAALFRAAEQSVRFETVPKPNRDS